MLFRTGHNTIQTLSLTCSLLVALRGCGRGRWHDNRRGDGGRG